MKEFVIETKGLTKKFGEAYGVRNLDLHVERGNIYGLLGRNGAGKTTTMRMLLNLVKPTEGEILLFGKAHQQNPTGTYRRIGSLIETPGFYENLTGRENLQLLARLRGRHRRDCVDHALEIVGLADEPKKLFSQYSLGMKQRLGIAAAVMHEPELLVLDEPTNGLDPVGIRLIRQFLTELSKEKGTAILISSHVLSEIEQLADVIGVMREGCLIEEADMEELRRRNRRYVEFEVSDERLACLLLEKHFRAADYSLHEQKTLRLFECMEQRGEINRCFVENGLSVTKININEEKLEDYFSKLTGGDQVG